MNRHPDLVLVANTRLPSRRAQALQVTQMASAFVRAGSATSVLHAARAPVLELPPGTDALDWYLVPKDARPTLVPVRCIDWIDRVPRILQYVPARLQEQSFARHAARLACERFGAARVLSREIETGVLLARADHARLFLEIHRVPGGRLRRRWLVEAASSARGVLAISGGVARDLASLGLDPGRIRVEHDGFDAARFEALPDRATARASLDLPRDGPLVVYTGGLLEWKGVDLVIEAARTLPDVYFAVAGGMEADVARLRQRTGGLQNVRIDGFQPPERVAVYLAAADLGVVPNRSEPAISARYTSPLKVFESMAAGLPLVVSDVPALREVLEDGTEAVFVAPDDSRALRDGIARLFADASGRARIGATLRARSSRHTWLARAERILAWMDEAESRAPASRRKR